MKPTFEHVGPKVDFGTVLIQPEEAETFRKTLLQGAKIRKLEINDESSLLWTTSYATGVLSTAAADYGVDESAYYAKTLAGSNPDYWRSVITFARYNSQQADTKIYNIYEVESQSGELMSAVRKVRIIRNLTRLTFNNAGEPYEDSYSRQRKAFEYPMESRDVEAVETRVTQIMNRQRVIDARKDRR